jgi:hypothetical protein
VPETWQGARRLRKQASGHKPEQHQRMTTIEVIDPYPYFRDTIGIKLEVTLHEAIHIQASLGDEIMYRIPVLIVMAVALVGLSGITSCEKSDNAHPGSDSAAVAMDTSKVEVDSGMGGTTVSTTEKEYEVDGAITSVEGDMVTIQHDEITDYRPAGSDSYKLANPDMAQYIKAGDSVEITLMVAGTQALITEIQKEDE